MCFLQETSYIFLDVGRSVMSECRSEKTILYREQGSLSTKLRNDLDWTEGKM